MEQKNLSVSYLEYDSMEELPAPDRGLLEQAKKAWNPPTLHIHITWLGQQSGWGTVRSLPAATRRIWLSRRDFVQRG